MRTRIAGLGVSVPDNVVANDDLTQWMETSDEWIRQRTGIEQRRHIAEDTGASDLGEKAALAAMNEAGVEPGDIDLIVFATLSPDYEFPASACLLQKALGCRPIPAFDVRNQCSGFVYGLSVVDAYIRNGRAKTALLVGGEVHSSALDFTTRGRDISVLFGDGAGAVVLTATGDDDCGILSTHLHAEGKYAEKLWLPAVGSRDWPNLTEEMLDGDVPPLYPHMEGRYVFKHAVTRFPEVIREALDANGKTLDDLDLLVPHQANLRISQFVAGELGLDENRVFNNIQKYGNTTACSIPLALYEAREAGKLEDGKLVCLAAFGAGFTWASALLRWG